MTKRYHVQVCIRYDLGNGTHKDNYHPYWSGDYFFIAVYRFFEAMLEMDRCGYVATKLEFK